MPRIFATSILAKNMQEAAFSIDQSDLFDESQKLTAKRIIKFLISSRSIAEAGNDDAESRVDYIADRLGLDKADVIGSINTMREIGLLADSFDMNAYIYKTDSCNKSMQVLDRFAKLENYLLRELPENGDNVNLKEVNDAALNSGLASSTVKNIRTILYFWTIKGYIHKSTYSAQNRIEIVPTLPVEKLLQKFDKRIDLCRFIVDELFNASSKTNAHGEDVPVQFSLVSLYQTYNKSPHLELYSEPVTSSDVADALLYLSKIGAVNLQGGFLVSCLAMLANFEATNRTKYRSDLEEFINESNFEDFYRSEKGVVFVSTIHKAKGREFDCVYLLLNHVNLDSDENKRKVYVGITRAKNELYIHYNNDLFVGYDLEVTEDTVNYGEPNELTLQLTHKDVFLDYFKDKQEAILDLRSGDNLQIDDNCLQTPRSGRLYSIVRFSKAFVEKINKLADIGYSPSTATVRFILWWKPQDEEKEMVIVLPEIKFTRE